LSGSQFWIDEEFRLAKVSNDVVIIGIGETPVGDLPGLTSVDIQARAVALALQDAGLTVHDLDGLINQDPYCEPNSMFALTLCEYIGASVTWCQTIDVGGMASSITMLQSAVWAIEAGQCEMVAVVFGENFRTGRPPASHGFVAMPAGAEEWEVPFGVQGAVIPYAMIAQRFMHETGATSADFGEVAVVMRKHASLNENAILRTPITLDDYMASRMIADPLRLLDCSIPSDGGGAFILTTKDRARKMNANGVGIRSIAMKASHNSIVAIPNISEYPIKAAGTDAFESAGLGPSDIDVFLCHDAFTVSVLLVLEALGFAKPGESGEYMRSGAATLGGRCPINPHGGLLSQAHAGGIFHPVEAVRQLRGGAGVRQVENARHAMISGNGGMFGVSAAMIMEKV
jgi:acetyl-CoA acetyltransferase